MGVCDDNGVFNIIYTNDKRNNYPTSDEILDLVYYFSLIDEEWKKVRILDYANEMSSRFGGK